VNPVKRFDPSARISRTYRLAVPMNWTNLLNGSLTRLSIGVFVSLIIQPFHLSLSLDALGGQKAVQTPKETERPARSFKATRISNGKTPDGVWYSFTEFQADDGSLAYNLVIPFESATRAEEELRRRIKVATKIVRTDPQFDKKGKKVGRRVLAVYPETATDPPIVKLSWTVGPTYFEINSISMANVLELERQSDAAPQGQPKVGQPE